MMTNIRAWATVAAVALFVPPPSVGAPQAPAAPAGSATFEAVNVCERVTGDAVAKAVGGRVVDTRPINLKNVAWARCVYGIEIDGTRQAFVVWLNPAGDFEGLRQAAGRAGKPATGVGDEAYVAFNDEDKRYALTALKRGVVTVQVTGEQREWVQRIATLALSTF